MSRLEKDSCSIKDIDEDNRVLDQSKDWDHFQKAGSESKEYKFASIEIERDRFRNWAPISMIFDTRTAPRLTSLRWIQLMVSVLERRPSCKACGEEGNSMIFERSLF